MPFHLSSVQVSFYTLTSFCPIWITPTELLGLSSLRARVITQLLVLNPSLVITTVFYT